MTGPRGKEAFNENWIVLVEREPVAHPGLEPGLGAADPVFPLPPGWTAVPDVVLVQGTAPGGGAGAAGSSTAAGTSGRDSLTSAPTDAGSSPPEMLGDLPPLPMVFRSSSQSSSSVVLFANNFNSSSNSSSSSGSRGPILPSNREYKIGDNDSPRPRDRVYFSFNEYDNYFNSSNPTGPGGIRNIQIYRETLGVEKTVLDGEASIGFRLPLNTFNADTSIPGLNGNSTDVGDLAIILKAVAYHSDDWNRLISGGLLVTAPTGPSSFASDGAVGLHDAALQPFVGYLYNTCTWYVQGFSSIDVPTDRSDVTLWFNDVALGYYLLNSSDSDRFLTRVAPTVELHVNTPLNHRGLATLDNPTGAPDLVDVTGGLDLEFSRAARLAVGVAAPVSGPKPFDVEWLVQLRYAF